MAGLSIPLFTDEQIDPRLGRALSDRGYDVLTCQEAERANRRISDEDQLAYATDLGRALLTFNAVDFLQIDAAWKRVGRRHAGIILAPQIRSVSELIARVEQHLLRVTPAQQDDTLLWLVPAPSA